LSVPRRKSACVVAYWRGGVRQFRMKRTPRRDLRDGGYVLTHPNSLAALR
jgi:hypothetical protein